MPGVDAAERLAAETDASGRPLFPSPTEAAAERLEPGGAPGQGRRYQAVVTAGTAAALAAVVAVTVASTGHWGAKNVDATYRQTVAGSFAPVLHANRQLSAALGRLDAAPPVAAQRAAAHAQRATASARRHLVTLSAPAGSQQVRRHIVLALDRERTYLAAVSGVLARPGGWGATRLPSLAGRAAGALDAIAAPMPAAGASVRGSGSLAAWGRSAASR